MQILCQVLKRNVKNVENVLFIMENKGFLKANSYFSSKKIQFHWLPCVYLICCWVKFPHRKEICRKVSKKSTVIK